MTAALSRRIADAFLAPDIPTRDRTAIVTAAEHADEFIDLPAHVQRLVESLEAQINSG